MTDTRGFSRDVAFVAVFAALIVALGVTPAVPVGSAGVPILLQNLGIMVAGLVLGARRGLYSVALFMILALAGLPILSGGRSGLTAINSPTVGFFLGYIPAVAVIGLLAMNGRGRNPFVNIGAAIVGGIGVAYFFGILGMMWKAGLGLGAALTASAVYIPGDLLKAVVAGTAAAAVHRAFPELLGRGR